MAHDLMDDLEQRLRAARPRLARSEEDAFDAALLARVREQPIASRRAVPRALAVPVVAGIALTVTAVVTLGGGPGNVGGPAASAAAISQTLHWLTPEPGTILHARSIEVQGGHTTTRELWQSGDDPSAERLRTEAARTYEVSGGALYDPSTNTIYDSLTPKPARVDAGQAEKKPAHAGAAPNGKDGAPISGDPIVRKVRTLLRDGEMAVTGPEVHNGTSAWVISLKPDAGRPVWKLWVAAADGKPLELRDPGRDASEAPQVIRWPVYEVVPDSGADALLTLTGAHPSATVVHDPDRVPPAAQDLLSDEG